jgi:hypothetical protein
VGKVHLDRLRRRVGYTGETYERLMAKIIAANHESISNAVGRMKVGRIKDSVRRMRGAEWRTMILPNLQDVLPKRSVFIRKGADRGKLLTDDLRGRLTGDLRGVLLEFSTKTGLPTFVRRTGAEKGQINEELVKEFREQIVKTFEGYTKVDPTIGVPRNVNAIAITEARSVINDIKHTYYTRLAEKNPDVDVRKRWVQHPSLSKEPRPGHGDVDGTEIEIDQAFDVPEYKKVGDHWVATGKVVSMMHPHAPGAGPEDVINCHCDITFLARKKRA